MSLSTESSPLWIQARDVDGDGSHWLCFERPTHVIRCDDVRKVDDCLRQVQQWVDDGYTAAGFVSYEAAPAFDASMQVVAGGSLPLLWFGLYVDASITRYADLPGLATMATSRAPELAALNWRASVNKKDYCQAIDRIKHAIAAGDSYQVNYTYRLTATGKIDPWQLFLHLQQAQQGHYGAYLDLGEQVICSASPELFYAVDGQSITTRPMKGTVARGCNAADDQRQRQALLNSEKDRAENLMIVDMLRNDLGRIAQPGSITVEQLWQLEAYPTLWQMTTPVTARLQPDVGLPELFRALFPCASITGAPKVKTMELISELEQQPRQIYTGSLGFVTPAGRSQFNVAIRTVLYQRQQQRIDYGVGGGIVWDSQPESEWQETRTKARVLPGLAPFCLLETLLWQPQGGYTLLKEHLQRLQRSAAHFGYPMDSNAVRHQLIMAAARQLPQRWRVRCLLAASGALDIQFIAQPQQIQRHPVRLRVARSVVHHDDPSLVHKTDQRQRYQQLLSEVMAGDDTADVDDVLMINERGEVTETTIANVVAYIDGRWQTPPLSCGLLPGTFRQALLEQGRISEGVITLADLNANTPLFTINSVRGWRFAKLYDKGED